MTRHLSWARLLERHGDSWALRIIWLAERLDRQGPGGLDYLGSLESMGPTTPADRFRLACGLLPHWSDFRSTTGITSRSTRAARRRRYRRMRRIVSVSFPLTVVIAGLDGWYAYSHRSARTARTLEAMRHHQPVTAQAKDAAFHDLFGHVVGTVGPVVAVMVALLALLLVALLTGTAVWAWLDSGRAARNWSRH